MTMSSMMNGLHGRILGLLLFLGAALVCCSYSYIAAEQGLLTLASYGILGLVEVAVFVVACFIVEGRLLSFATMFAVILFLFTYGQPLLAAVYPDYPGQIRLSLLFNEQTLLDAMSVINLAFVALLSGTLCMLSFSTAAPKEKRGCVGGRLTEAEWRRVGRTIVVLTLPVKMAIDGYYLLLSFTSGFLVARDWLEHFYNILIAYGNIAFFGLAFLMVLYSDDRKVRNGIFGFVMVYLLVIMAAGVRSENVAYLCGFFLVYMLSSKRHLSALQVVGIVAAAFVLLGFLQAVTSFRDASSRDFAGLLEILIKSITVKNPIFSTLDEFGNTCYTAICVIELWLPGHPAFNGMSYLEGLTAIVPSLFGICGALTEQSCFPILLQKAGTLNSEYFNIGGSVLGEFFFNFGLTGGVLAAFVFGLGVGFVSRKIVLAIENRDYGGLVFLIPVVFAATYWVRDYFGGRVREVAWCVLMAYVVISYVLAKRKS